MEPTIAIATAADRVDVLQLLAAQMVEHDIAIEGDRLASAIEGVLSDPSRGALLVARVDGDQVVGVAYLSWTWSLEHGGRSSWLEELYVLPEQRDQGVGTRLLHAAIELARLRGCIAVDLEVEASHERAAKLYAREGFSKHSRARWVKKL